MARRGHQRKLALALIVLGLVLPLLAGCSACWDLLQIRPTIVVSPPSQTSGGTWIVTVSVTNMPNGGLAGIAIGPNGLTFSPDVDLGSVEIEALNGFIITWLNLPAPAPSGCLTALNPIAGVEGGFIFRITFAATSNSPSITLDETVIDLIDALNEFITNWEIVTAEYYAK